MEGMGRSPLLLAAVLGSLLPGAPAAPPPEDPLSALLGAARADEEGRRRAALEALLPRLATLPSAEVPRVRAVLGERLPRETAPPVRALLVRGLAGVGGEASLPPLLAALAVEGEPGPQEALVEAFADLPAAAAGRALADVAFGEGDPGPRSLAAEALGRVPGTGPLRALLALATSAPPWPVKAGALRALALRGDPRAGDAAAAALGDPDPAVRSAARECLARLLGTDPPEDPAEAAAAWAAGRPGWLPPEARPRVEAAAGDSTALPREERGTAARFFGIPVTGRRVAFVLDCSQSKWGEKAATSRAELEAAVKGLRGSQRFGLVLFHQRVWTWREDLVPATPAQKWACVRTFPDLPTKSYTNIHDALERAFGWAGAGRRTAADPPGLDAIYLLSDGEPNRGRLRDPARIAAAAREWNPGARVRVHTVALGARPAAGLLEALAAESGGVSVRR
jgi:HEAT repeat protein